MSTELTYLVLTSMLAASLWIPFIVGVTTEDSDFTDFTRPPDLTTMRPWVHRAWRVHQNLLETFVPFAAVVLAAHLASVSNTVTIWASIAFFWLRLLHAIGMLSGLATFPIRPIIFTASWLCTIAIGATVLLG